MTTLEVVLRQGECPRYPGGALAVHVAKRPSSMHALSDAELPKMARCAMVTSPSGPAISEGSERVDVIHQGSASWLHSGRPSKQSLDAIAEE